MPLQAHPDPDRRRCRLCATPLEPGAVYCLACEHFQSPLREAFGKFSPAFILSLIALAGLGYNFLRTTVLEPRPNLTATALTCNADKVLVGLENSGTRSAVLVGGSVAAAGTAARNLSDASLPLVVQPGATRMVWLTLYATTADVLPSPMPLGVRQCAYKVSLLAKDFAGVSRAPAPFGCGC